MFLVLDQPCAWAGGWDVQSQWEPKRGEDFQSEIPFLRTERCWERPEVAKLKEAFEAMKRREDFILQMEVRRSAIRRSMPWLTHPSASQPHLNFLILDSCDWFRQGNEGVRSWEVITTRADFVRRCGVLWDEERRPQLGVGPRSLSILFALLCGRPTWIKDLPDFLPRDVVLGVRKPFVFTAALLHLYDSINTTLHLPCSFVVKCSEQKKCDLHGSSF